MKCKFNDGRSCLECEFSDHTIFRGLTTDQRRQLQYNVVQLEVKRKQNIFVQGNIPQYIFFVKEGKVKLYLLGENGKEHIVRVAKEGDVLGYRSLMGGENYKATAVALNDTKLCAVTRTFFSQMIEQNGIVAKDVLKLLAGDLRDSENRMFSLSYKSVRERIAEGVLMLADAYGMENDGKTIAVQLYRKDIADFSGVTVETSIRNLNDFRKEGLLEIDHKKISILNFEGLREVAKLRS